jgi:Intron-binding protein aquarius N-terminus
MGLQLRPASAQGMQSPKSKMADKSANERWEHLARDLWLPRSTTQDARAETIKSRIWDSLEAEAFNLRSLSALENLQILEQYEFEA